MTEIRELLPCPFCGGSELLVEAMGITCRGCQSQVLGSGVKSDAETWNRRTPPAPVSGNAVSDEMVEAGLAHYAEGGCSGLDERERREVVTNILEAALSASVAESEPVARVDASYGNDGALLASFQPNALPIGTLLFASPPSVEEGKAWQPIETAPKDGTKIDLWVHYNEGDQHKRVPNARWDDIHQDWDFGPLMFRSKQYALPAIPTHWMPIPAAPDALSEAK